MAKNSKIKRFLARVNRGLVLGLVLGVILVSFVVADTLKFNKDTDKIRENIISYITAMAQLNGKQETSSLGKAITEQDRAAMTEELERIFDIYCADPARAVGITVYDGYDNNEIARELEVWFDKTSSFKVISVQTKSDDDAFRISFERQGYRYALVRLNDLPLAVTLTEPRGNEIDIFLGGGPSYLIDPKYPDGVEVWGSQRERTIYVSGSIYLTMVDGEWRILMSDFYTQKAPELD